MLLRINLTVIPHKVSVNFVCIFCRFNGLVHKKTVGIEPAENGKGVVLVTRKTSGKLL